MKDTKNTGWVYKPVGIFLIILGAIPFPFINGFYLKLAFIIGGVFILIFGGRNKKNIYKEEKAPMQMNIHHVFYVLGVVFILGAVIYFAREFIADLPTIIKLILLIVSFLAMFMLAEVFRGRDM